jgi:hypothetical protein
VSVIAVGHSQLQDTISRDPSAAAQRRCRRIEVNGAEPLIGVILAKRRQRGPHSGCDRSANTECE